MAVWDSDRCGRKFGQTLGLIAGLLGVALLLGACGGETADAADGGSETPTTATTVAATTATTATVTSTIAPTTTTTEPGVTYASLDEEQREVLDRICGAALDSSQSAGFGEPQILTVLAGYVGVPDLEAVWTDLGPSADRSVLLEAAAPICTDLNWSPPAATTTTTVVEALATVTVVIGDIQISGETKGCPMTEILANEYWVGPNGDEWTDIVGETWQVSLSVDATDDDLKWSFSLTRSPHRLISYHLNESRFEAQVSEDLAVFETNFGDQLASISGGYPDTPGTVVIMCG